jgi:hypothetical protein
MPLAYWSAFDGAEVWNSTFGLKPILTIERTRSTPSWNTAPWATRSGCLDLMVLAIVSKLAVSGGYTVEYTVLTPSASRPFCMVSITGRVNGSSWVG